MTITTEQLASVTGGNGNVVTSAGEKIGSIGQVYLDDATGEPTGSRPRPGFLAPPSPSSRWKARTSRAPTSE